MSKSPPPQCNRPPGDLPRARRDEPVLDGPRQRGRTEAIAHTFGGTYADVEINTNGEIWLIDPKQPMVTDYTFVSLEGITFDNADDGSCQTC